MHAHYIELLYNLKHVRRISAKPVQLGDQNNIAFLHLYLQGLKPWPVGIAAGRLVREYSGRVDACGFQCFHLQL